MSLRVGQLLDGLPILASQGLQPEALVSGITDDSRQLQPGAAFVAVRGATVDGHQFLAAASAAGASLMLLEQVPQDAALSVPWAVVENLAALRGTLAARFYAEPSAALAVVATTGTNGKTSVAHYVAQLAGRQQQLCGYMGTIGWGQLGALQTAALTTVDAFTLQQRLRDFVDAGCTMVSLEASSHALAQARLQAVAIDVAVFTNLTRDHLDFHGSVAAYAAAKRRLFEWPGLQAVVTNLADPVGREIAAAAAPGILVAGYGSAEDAHPRTQAWLYWSDLQFTPEGICGRWTGSWGEAAFALPLLGAFAVANVAAAMAALLVQGLPFAAVAATANELVGVPGRMEPIRVAGAPLVVVDYAHTPDALASALAALRDHTGARLVLVFGCGGDRDRGKRPQMGAIAAQGADVVYLTSDNPRGEQPEVILDDIYRGVAEVSNSTAEVHRIADRRDAIRAAIAAASSADVVLIAGKGHEDYQEVQGVRLPLDDRALVRELLEDAA
ncbi:MAG: UDP-N-acetylmuramoyl-L-alanyl-D-glutamate--2,6-diaminopimelate ligase [Pseudomonadales bacterium]